MELPSKGTAVSGLHFQGACSKPPFFPPPAPPELSPLGIFNASRELQGSPAQGSRSLPLTSTPCHINTASFPRFSESESVPGSGRDKGLFWLPGLRNHPPVACYLMHPVVYAASGSLGMGLFALEPSSVAFNRPRLCISNKLPGDAKPASARTGL